MYSDFENKVVLLGIPMKTKDFFFVSVLSV